MFLFLCLVICYVHGIANAFDLEAAMATNHNLQIPIFSWIIVKSQGLNYWITEEKSFRNAGHQLLANHDWIHRRTVKNHGHSGSLGKVDV